MYSQRFSIPALIIKIREACVWYFCLKFVWTFPCDFKAVFLLILRLKLYLVEWVHFKSKFQMRKWFLPSSPKWHRTAKFRDIFLLRRNWISHFIVSKLQSSSNKVKVVLRYETALLSLALDFYFLNDLGDIKRVRGACRRLRLKGSIKEDLYNKIISSLYGTRWDKLIKGYWTPQAIGNV